MGQTTIETRMRITHLLNSRFALMERVAEDVKVSRAVIYELMKKFKEHNMIADLRKTPRQRIL